MDASVLHHSFHNREKALSSAPTPGTARKPPGLETNPGGFLAVLHENRADKKQAYAFQIGRAWLFLRLRLQPAFDINLGAAAIAISGDGLTIATVGDITSGEEAGDVGQG